MLSVSPIVFTPAVASDTLARARDGQTIVVSGFTFNRDSKEGRKRTRSRHELVILLTPRILPSGTD